MSVIIKKLQTFEDSLRETVILQGFFVVFPWVSLRFIWDSLRSVEIWKQPLKIRVDLKTIHSDSLRLGFVLFSNPSKFFKNFLKL